MTKTLLLLLLSMALSAVRGQDTAALIVGGIEQLEDTTSDPTIANAELFGCPGVQAGIGNII